MPKQSRAWKDLEREAAKALKGERILRGGDYSVSAPDVDVPDMPWLRIDCKYRKAHTHHTLLDDVKRKYCNRILTKQIPVLVTKHHRQQGANVTIPLWYFAELLDTARAMQREASDD